MTEFYEVRQGFIANSSPLASIIASYIRVEALKPVFMESWALRGTGRASGATGYPIDEGRWSFFDHYFGHREPLVHSPCGICSTGRFYTRGKQKTSVE